MSKRRMGDPAPMENLIQAFLKINGLEGKYYEAAACQAWSKVVSEDVVSHTVQVSAERGVLFVRVDSPALKADLRLRAEELLLAIHQELGRNVIHTLAVL